MNRRASKLTRSVSLLVAALPALAFADGIPGVVQFDRDDGTVSWKVNATKDGVTLEQRNVAGSSYREYRAVVESPVDPTVAAGEVWDAMRAGDMENLKHRDILRQSDNELVIYDQIRAAVVSDRDYVIRVRRIYDASRHRTEFRCESTSEGPPPAKGYVRMPVIRAGWIVEPNGRGGTRLTQYAYSEPGGWVSAWLVRGAQADRSMNDVHRMLRRLRAVSSAKR